jgi:hypothetical protein
VIRAQVRVWDSTYGSTYEQAALSQLGLFGYSQPPFLITLAQSPAPAPALVGLQPFSLSLPNGLYAPLIDKQPRTQNAPIGATVYFGVHATNPVGLGDIGGPFYQWYFNLTNRLTGATNPVLKLTNVQPAQAGSFHVVVGNLEASTFSTVVDLGVIDTALPAPPVPVLAVSNGVGSNYVLQYASGLSPAPAWQELAVLTPTNSPQLYVDGSSTNAPSRIYRLVQVP